MRLPFKALGRDLFFESECSCPDPKWQDRPIMASFKSRVRLSGYADDNFFDRVNAAPRSGECRVCGRKYQYQWFRDGVEFTWVGEAVA